MINKTEPLWWTILKMIVGLPGGLIGLFLAVMITYEMITYEFYWDALLFAILFFLIGGYLITIFILGIIKLVKYG